MIAVTFFIPMMKTCQYLTPLKKFEFERANNEGGVAACARRAKMGRGREMGRREMSRRPASARADNRSRNRAIGAPSYRFGSRRSDSSHAERLENGEKRD